VQIHVATPGTVVPSGLKKTPESGTVDAVNCKIGSGGTVTMLSDV
jgi:hypothetical protein